MKMNAYSLFGFISLSAVLVLRAQAAFTIDFTGNNAYDGQDPLLISFVDNGNTASVSLVPTGGAFNSNSDDFGIVDDQIDGTDESITITFDTDIEFNSIDFGGVGSDIDDGVSLRIADFSINLFTGVVGFNGQRDEYTPTPSIALSVGESIIITGSSSSASFDLQSLTVSIIPESGAFSRLLALSALIGAIGGSRVSV